MAAEPQEGGLLTSGNVPQTPAADRSAAGLQYQKFSGETQASGEQLGQGLRSVTSVAPVTFNPQNTILHNMSGGQFSGGHAKSSMGEGEM